MTIEQLLKALAAALDEGGIPYMIIGGQAVLLYGTPRLTRDIDITLGIDTDEYARIEAVCDTLRLHPLPDNPKDFAEDTKVLPVAAEDLRIRVDFIFSYTPYETQALNRVRGIPIGGREVKFASPEDVIIHKMIAGRAVDGEDVRNIVIKNRKALDQRYIKRWLSEFESIPEQEGLRERYEALLKSIGI